MLREKEIALSLLWISLCLLLHKIRISLRASWKPVIAQPRQGPFSRSQCREPREGLFIDTCGVLTTPPSPTPICHVEESSLSCPASQGGKVRPAAPGQMCSAEIFQMKDLPPCKSQHSYTNLWVSRNICLYNVCLQKKRGNRGTACPLFGVMNLDRRWTNAYSKHTEHNDSGS